MFQRSMSRRDWLAVCGALGILAENQLRGPLAQAFVEPSEKTNPVPVLADVGPADDGFARALFAQLGTRPGNLTVSPASVESCLMLAFAGARRKTATEMAATLHLPSGDPANAGPLFDRLEARLGLAPGANKPASKLTIANSVWVQQGLPIEAAYRRVLTARQRATFEQADFAHNVEAARAAINRWVDAGTMHKIPQLFAPGSLKSDARMVLANAIYFKGTWESPFREQATKPAPFRRPGKPDLSVPLMAKTDDFSYLETDTYQALELPYSGTGETMVVWLPKRLNGLPDLEKQLAGESTATSLQQSSRREVEVYLPRFKVESDLELVEPLQAMGMRDAFSDAADFSGISSEPLKIGKVVHQALVEVDEKGTEAAAATGAVAIPLAAAFEPEPKKVFRADHPFLFAIRNRSTGELLFLGRVENPQGA